MRRLIQSGDLKAIETGLTPGVGKAEREAAIRVLAELGFQPISDPVPPKRKTGPKPKMSANLTEEEIRIRTEFVRLILGSANRKLSFHQVLSAVLKLFKIFRTYCSEGLFLTDSERSKLRNVCRYGKGNAHLLFRLPRVAPEMNVDWDDVHPSHEFQIEEWLNSFGKAGSRSTRIDWNVLVDNAVEEMSLIADEKQIFSGIKEQLNVDFEGPSNNVIEEKITALSSDPSLDDGRDPELRSLKIDKWQRELYMQTSKNDTLRFAIAKLFEIRGVLDRCRHVDSNSATERLYVLVTCCSRRLPPGAAPPVLDELATIFVESVKRQGASPFPVLFFEELNPGPAQIPEDGQLTALPSSEAISRVQLIVHAVTCAGEHGVAEQEIVQRIAEQCERSEKTVYRDVSNAIKMGGIRKDGRTLYNVD